MLVVVSGMVLAVRSAAWSDHGGGTGSTTRGRGHSCSPGVRMRCWPQRRSTCFRPVTG